MKDRVNILLHRGPVAEILCLVSVPLAMLIMFVKTFGLPGYDTYMHSYI